MDTEALIEGWSRFRFDQPPIIPLPVLEPPTPSIDNFEKALRGEDLLTVTPLQVAVAAAALGEGGAQINPQIVSAVRDNGRWQAFEPTPSAVEPIISPQAAAGVMALFSPTEENIAEWDAVVQAGPSSFNSWYVGFFPAAEPSFVVVVVIENEADPRIVREIGRRLLQLTLD